MVKYFKATSYKRKDDVYYAAYTLEAAKQELASDYNSQIIFDVVEVETVPAKRIVHICSDLAYEDAKRIARTYN